MKQELFCQVLTGLMRSLAIASLGTYTATVVINQPSYAVSTTFNCSQSNGVPTTFAHTPDGQHVAIIRWVSNFGSTTLQRCQEVSRRFQKNYDNGSLKYITTGNLHGQPVICAAIRANADCTEKTLLFTLKPGSDANATLQRLLDKRGLAAGRVLIESASNTLNIDFSTYLKTVSQVSQ